MSDDPRPSDFAATIFSTCQCADPVKCPRCNPPENAARYFACCDHCGCGEPGGVYPVREGHDDTCRHGCNDAEANDLLEHVDA